MFCIIRKLIPLLVPGLFFRPEAWLKTAVLKFAHAKPRLARSSLRAPHLPPKERQTHSFISKPLDLISGSGSSPSCRRLIPTDHLSRLFWVTRLKRRCPWGLTGSAGGLASTDYCTKHPLECGVVKSVVENHIHFENYHSFCFVAKSFYLGAKMWFSTNRRRISP